MGRKSIRKKLTAIIAVFDDKNIKIQLDDNENIIDKNSLEELAAISNVYRIKYREKLKKLKMKRKKLQFSERTQNNVSGLKKEFSFFDDKSFETKIMNDFFDEIEREHLITKANVPKQKTYF